MLSACCFNKIFKYVFDEITLCACWGEKADGGDEKARRRNLERITFTVLVKLNQVFSSSLASVVAA